MITIPANFRQRQKVETIKAAKLAGLNVLKLINEPTAAAIAYGFQNEVDKIVLVYDFGGGFYFQILAKSMITRYFRRVDSEMQGIDLFQMPWKCRSYASW